MRAALSGFAGGVAGLFVLLAPSPAPALETNWDFDMRLTVSDNLGRLSPGSEEGGSLLSLSAGPRLKFEEGGTSFHLAAALGAERTEGEEDGTSSLYRVRGNLRRAAESGSFLALTMEASQETTEAGSGDAGLTRLRDRRDRAFLEGGRKGPSGEWKATGTWDRRDRETRSESLTAALSGKAAVGRQWSWEWSASGTDGETEDVGETGSWTGAEARTAFVSSAGSSRWGVELGWSGSSTDPAGTEDQAAEGVFRAKGFRSGEPTRRTSWSVSLGGEGWKGTDAEREWKAGGDASLKTALGRDASLSLRGARGFSPLRSESGDPVWSEHSDLAFSADWILGRGLGLKVFATARKDRFPEGEEGAAAGERREDEVARAGLDLSLAAGRGSALRIGVSREEAESTLSAYDLVENRADLTFTGSY